MHISKSRLLAVTGFRFRSSRRRRGWPGTCLEVRDVAAQPVEVNIPDKNLLIQHRIIYFCRVKKFAGKSSKQDITARHLCAQACQLADLPGRKVSLDIAHERVNDGWQSKNHLRAFHLISQRTQNQVLIFSTRKHAYITNARQSQRLLSAEMLRTLRKDQALAAVGTRATIDATRRNRNIQTTQCIDNLRKDVHVGDHVMIHFQSKIQIEGTGEKTWTMFVAAISIGGGGSLIVPSQTGLGFSNLYPQGKRKLHGPNGLSFQ